MTGVARGESCLFISLSQSTRMLERIAASHGWTLDGIHVHAITPREVLRRHDARQDIFVPDEVELVDIADRIRDVVARVRPDQLVFDSLSFVEVLAATPGRFEHELAALVEMLGDLDVTALFMHTTEDGSTTDMIADGAIALEHLAEDFAGVRYRLRIEKVRASTFRGGNHDFEIVRGGLRVYPRLTMSSRGRFAEEQGDRPRATFSSDIDALDEMAGGGLVAGTSCLIVGRSGAGKTSLATRYVHTAAEAGHRATYVVFEEVRDTIRYLSERGVVSIVTSATRGDHDGVCAADDLDVGESADVAIRLRYVMVDGTQAKGRSIIKRRDGGHATALRELIIDGQGLRVGALLPYPRWATASPTVPTPSDATSRH